MRTHYAIATAAESDNPATCAPPREPVTVQPGDTVDTLAARIRADRCGGPGGWMHTPEAAAAMMLSAERQRASLAKRYG